MHPPFTVRSGTTGDATTIAALAVQVFLDTYVTEGVRPDLAQEAFTEYGVDAFASRLVDPGRRFMLAEHATALLGFAETIVTLRDAPVAALAGAELVRLYVQPNAQRRGIGRRLLLEAERAVADACLPALWLTAWEGNERARRFYAAQGYEDVGATRYAFQGRTYGNRVFAKRFSS